MAAEYVRRLGERIRARREELGMTQEEVARLMPGKVSGSRISLWERGENKPRDDSLEHLAQVLETTVASLALPAPDKSQTPDPMPMRGDLESQLVRMEQRLAQQLAEHSRNVECLLERQSGILAHIEEVTAGADGALARLSDVVERTRQDLPPVAPRDQRAEGVTRVRKGSRASS